MIEKLKQKYKGNLILLLFCLLVQLPIKGQNDIAYNSSDLKEVSTDTISLSELRKLVDKFIYKNSDSAMLFARRFLQLAKRNGSKEQLADAYNNVAKIYYVKGTFFESLAYADSTRRLSKTIGYKKGLANGINNIGLVYLGQERFQEAISEFEESLKYNIEFKDSSNIAVSLFNIGLCYDELRMFQKAFDNLNRAFLISKQQKYDRLTLMSLNRIGETHYHEKNYEQALSFFRLALRFPDYQDNWEKTFAHSGIARTLYEMQMYKEASHNAYKAYVLAQQLNAKWDIERAVTILSKCYAALGDYKQAYFYQAVSSSYSDSLRNEKRENEMNYLHLQEERAQNLELSIENRNSKETIKNNQLVIFLTVVFLIVLVCVLFLLWRSISHKNILNSELQRSNEEIVQQKLEIQKQQEKLVSINKTKDLVLSVIGHDLRSPFASIRQALDIMEEGYLGEEEKAVLYEDFSRQISVVSELIDNLLAWASNQHSGQPVQYERVNLTDIADSVGSLYKLALLEKNLRFLHADQPPVFIQANENHVRIILQNIISNAIKYTPERGTVSLFYTEQEDSVAIHIKDDGRGMAPEKLAKLFKASGKSISESGTNNERGTGLGLLLIQQFIKENNGRIEVFSEIGKGSEFIVYFSKPGEFMKVSNAGE